MYICKYVKSYYAKMFNYAYTCSAMFKYVRMSKYNQINKSADLSRRRACETTASVLNLSLQMNGNRATIRKTPSTTVNLFLNHLIQELSLLNKPSIP